MRCRDDGSSGTDDGTLEAGAQAGAAGNGPVVQPGAAPWEPWWNKRRYARPTDRTLREQMHITDLGIGRRKSPLRLTADDAELREHLRGHLREVHDFTAALFRRGQEQGVIAARATAAEVAWLLGLHPEQVLVLSTGVIGKPLPLDKVLGGVRCAALQLSRTGGAPAAEAIMTTDTQPKESLARGEGFAVGGMAKGSGMIHPKLATMLAVVTTDYPPEPGEAAA